MLNRPPIEGNTTCNLDCLRQKPIIALDGPVKIVLVDIPRKEYWKRMWWAGLIGLSYMLIGFVSITVILFISYYTSVVRIGKVRGENEKIKYSYLQPKSSWQTLHSFFLTAGFQFLMPISFLMLTNLNGPSLSMKPEEAKINHVILLVFAFILNTVGAVVTIIMVSGVEYYRPPEYIQSAEFVQPITLQNICHYVFGLIAVVLSGLATLFGSCVLFKSTCTKKVRTLFNCLTLTSFVCSSISYASSFVSKDFMEFYPLKEDLGIILSIFIGVYTAVVVIPQALSCVMCPNK